jgi:hypothetical protein
VPKNPTVDDVDLFPLDAPGRRSRLRRGGPRTPLPLLPMIAIAAGVGIAYVGQIAHATKTTYQESGLAAQQQRLRSDDAQLRDELARLESSERIVVAAQGLGMRPADRWGYATAQPVQLVVPPSDLQLTSARDR